MRRLLICGLVVLIAASVCVSGEEGAKKEISASELWELQRKYFQGISSFHFDMTITTVATGEDAKGVPAPGKNEVTMSWTVEGDKYRIGTSFQNKATGETDKAIYAFDGAQHQFLQGSTLFVEKTPDIEKVKYSPFLMSVPIFLAYGFAWPESQGVPQVNLGIMQRPETWAAAAKTTREIRRARTFDQDGVVLTLGEYERFGMRYSMEVFFAQDLGYFPIHWKTKTIAPAGESVGEWRVSKTKLVEGTVIPIRVEAEEASPQGKERISTVIAVNAATAKINQKVAPDVFTSLLPEDDIQSGKIKVVDVDAQKKRPR